MIDREQDLARENLGRTLTALKKAANRVEDLTVQKELWDLVAAVHFNLRALGWVVRR